MKQVIALVAAGAVLASTAATIGGVPVRADRYRTDLTRYAHLHWGLGAPVSLFAAQVQQESEWRPNARSPYANGMAQFTPATESDMKRWYRDTLGAGNAFSPAWALQAMVLYDRRLFKLLDDRAASECDQWAMTLASYNGGLGNVRKDIRLCAGLEGCDPSRWVGHVEKHSNRAQWAFRENRDYPKRIIFQRQPLYLARGWGGPNICEVEL